MKKLERIEKHEQKTREKIATLQTILKQIGGQRTEQENLQIIQQVRALKLSREDLYAFLNGGELPAFLAAALGEKAAEPEKIYSRRDKKRKNKNETAKETQTETEASESEFSENNFSYNNAENKNFSNFESEEIKNEN